MNLENIIDQLTQALNERKDFIYSENGLNIELKQTDNSTSISVEYNNEAKNLVDEFDNYVREIDDELFVDVCEELGNDKVRSIQDNLNQDNLDLIRESISEFNYALSKVSSNKIKKHREEIKKLAKYVRVDSIDENYSC